MFSSTPAVVSVAQPLRNGMGVVSVGRESSWWGGSSQIWGPVVSAASGSGEREGDLEGAGWTAIPAMGETPRSAAGIGQGSVFLPPLLSGLLI